MNQSNWSVATVTDDYVECVNARPDPDFLLNSRLSAFDGDNVCLDLAVHSLAPKPLGDRFRRDVGCFAEPRGVARLDLVP